MLDPDQIKRVEAIAKDLENRDPRAAQDLRADLELLTDKERFARLIEQGNRLAEKIDAQNAELRRGTPLAIATIVVAVVALAILGLARVFRH